MPFTYDQITIGSDTFDSYMTVAEADTILNADVRRFPIWDALDADAKGRALINSADRHDRIRWKGEKTEAANARDFPRTGLTDDEGNTVDSASIPSELEKSVAYLAVDITQDTSLSDSGSTATNIKRVQAGSAEVEFFSAESGTKLPAANQELVGIWMDVPVLGQKAFGTDVSSGIETHGRSEGF